MQSKSHYVELKPLDEEMLKHDHRAHSDHSKNQRDPSHAYAAKGENSRFTYRRREASRIIVEKLTKPNCLRFMGVFVLIGAIIGGSSIGTLANFIPVKSSFAKNAWRSGIVACLFIVPTIVEYFYKRKEVNYGKLITVK